MSSTSMNSANAEKSRPEGNSSSSSLFISGIEVVSHLKPVEPQVGLAAAGLSGLLGGAYTTPVGLEERPVGGGGALALRPIATGGELLTGNSDLAAGEEQNVELRRIHQIMRGRYRLATILLIVGAAAGAFIGFKCGKKLYASAGLIRVMAVVPKVLYSVDDKGTLPMFDSFVEAQATVLRSQRVMDLAMADPAWQSLGRGTSDRAAEDFAKEITISHEGEILRVMSLDPDPRAAVVEVTTLITAYQKIYSDEDFQSDERRTEVLQARKTSLSSDLANKRQQIMDIANTYGTDDLKALYQFKQEQVNKLDTAITDRQMLLTAAASDASATSRPTASAVTDEQVVEKYPELQALSQEIRGHEAQLERYKAMNLLPTHRMVQAESALLSSSQEKYSKRLDELKKRELTAAPVLVNATGNVVDQKKLEAEIKRDENLRQAMNEKLLTLGQHMLQIEELRKQANEVQAERDETQHRMDQLAVEATVSGRINVISAGDRPLGPFKDTRIPYSCAGGFGGGLFGFGIVAAAALMDRRLRSPDQADGGRLNAPMLGMLPRLPEDLSDPTQAAMAAHCVHEIRTLLQIWSRRSFHRVFAITSPDAGAGKTSLTLALGASYATANLRTLVVDCDLIAGGLSRRVDAIVKQKLGQILHGEGLVTEEQLAEALKLAHHGARRVGEVLLEQGHITAAQLSRAVLMQGEESLGILDAMRGRAIDDCVTETGIPNLQILPVGSATARDVPLLSPEALHRLIEALGQQYDVVLVDTGPILGSLEASLVAGTVDGVVLTVCKGEQRPLIERAMSQLVTVGARVAGVVFNGASAADIYTYGSGSRTRSGQYGVSGVANRSNPIGPLLPSRLGPLTAAITTFAPDNNRTPVRSTN